MTLNLLPRQPVPNGVIVHYFFRVFIVWLVVFFVFVFWFFYQKKVYEACLHQQHVLQQGFSDLSLLPAAVTSDLRQTLALTQNIMDKNEKNQHIVAGMAASEIWFLDQMQFAKGEWHVVLTITKKQSLDKVKKQLQQLGLINVNLLKIKRDENEEAMRTYWSATV